ncbi:hypothetical protein QBC37DRAFT_429937 [Rhypophila decipiens]|uniref:Rhodopsin domain-containing protein n=1 Tax=Rhypophila decipiens TaxID=261697 RepID=A0AAN6XZX8_9PEZI|nr:hypothetical protein QBC37DRAFT_429937 [Rhypophila decipiens]
MNSSSSDSSERTRPSVIDGVDASPVVQIMAWLCLVLSVLSVAAQFATKQLLARKLKSADWVLLGALILSVGQIAAILSPGGQGIGLSSDRQDDSAVDIALQVFYSSELLNIFALVATKAALLFALLAITPDTRHRVVIFATGAITLLWGISNLFAIAFQCPEPARWNVMRHGAQCVDLHAVRAFSAITNLLLDVILIVIPSIIIIPVQMTWDKRIKILGGFWCRVVPVCASIVQIILLYRSPTVFSLPTTTTEQGPDFLYELYKPTTTTLLVQTTGLMATTVPFLKPFLMSLESGFLRADDEARRQESTFGASSKGTASGGSNNNNNKKGSNKMWSASKYIEIRRQRAWAVEEVELGEPTTTGKTGFLGGGVPAVASVRVGNA